MIPQTPQVKSNREYLYKVAQNLLVNVLWRQTDCSLTALRKKRLLKACAGT